MNSTASRLGGSINRCDFFYGGLYWWYSTSNIVTNRSNLAWPLIYEFHYQQKKYSTANSWGSNRNRSDPLD